MDTSKLVPNDPRVRWETTTVRGKTYRYILGEPQDGREPLATILLVHGFPDMAFGWRCQIPFLNALGYRTIAPDMLGYAGTDAPADLAEYTMKSVSADLKALVEQVIGAGRPVILGGHDWGGMVVYKMKMWHPEMVSAIFSVCTPYTPPNREWIDLEAVVRTRLPNFTYQLQFAGPDVEAYAQGGAEPVRQLLASIMTARFPDGTPAMDVREGYDLARLAREGEGIGTPGAMAREELAFQVDEYMRHAPSPMRGPLNWYRTRRLNFEDEKAALDEGRAGPEVDVPVLYIGASRDAALPPALAGGMSRWITDLTTGEVDATHWALWETPDEVNALVRDWLAARAGAQGGASHHL